MSVMNTRTLSFGSRRPMNNSRLARSVTVLVFADCQALNLSRGDLFGREPLGLEGGFERAGDVPGQ